MAEILSLPTGKVRDERRLLQTINLLIQQLKALEARVAVLETP